MKNSVKKFLGVVAILFAAPLFMGGTVACSKDCKARCEDYNSACKTTTNCTTACDSTAACVKEGDAVTTCFGTDCGCTADPTGAACQALLTKCASQITAYTNCITPA